MNGIGKWVFLLRNYIVLVPLAFAMISQLCESEADEILWPVAIFLAGLGILMRAWSTCHCRYGHSGKQHALARTGPYAYIRNPLYVGNILIATGATVASELVWMIPVTLVWTFATYAIVAKVEEGRMHRKFGAEYEAYRNEVPAWFPNLTRKPRTTEHSAFFPALAWQSLRFVWLLPFLAKELGMFR